MGPGIPPLNIWEFSCPLNFVGSLPESLTQGLLVGKLLVGGLGVYTTCYILVLQSIIDWSADLPGRCAR